MEKIARLGRFFFAAAIAAFGVQHLLPAGAGPPWIALPVPWEYLVGAFLVLASIAIVVGSRVRLAATVLGAFLLVYALVFCGPGLVAELKDPILWIRFTEPVALGGGALVLAGALPGRFIFAATLVCFGVEHFLYAGFIAKLVPAWVPVHLFWAYFFGCAFIAVTLSIATRILTRLATTLLGAMFFLWFVLLHLPRAFAAVPSVNEWSSAFVALAMCGASWIIAETEPS